MEVVCATNRLSGREGLAHLLDLVVQVLQALSICDSPPVNVMVLEQVVDVLDRILVSAAVGSPLATRFCADFAYGYMFASYLNLDQKHLLNISPSPTR